MAAAGAGVTISAGTVRVTTWLVGATTTEGGTVVIGTVRSGTVTGVASTAGATVSGALVLSLIHISEPTRPY